MSATERLTSANPAKAAQKCRWSNRCGFLRKMARVILAVVTLCVVLPLLLSVVVIGTANDLSRGLLIKFKSRRKFMRRAKKFSIGSVALLLLVALAVVPVAAQQKKPNIMFIMADDIGWMQPSIYHRV
jgi:O-antigen ligase